MAACVVRVLQAADARRDALQRQAAGELAGDLAGDVAGGVGHRSDAPLRQRGPRAAAVELAAERDGAMVGLATLVVAGDGAGAAIEGVWVVPEARGVGVGRALVDASIAEARRRGLRQVEIAVADGAREARALALAAGFVETGDHVRVRRDSLRLARWMRRRLAPLVMGVVNVTPDSFSDGGQFLDGDAAIEHGLALREDGADILDVGGEATNPRAAPTPARDELARIERVIAALASRGARVSVDTTKAEVAVRAVAAGATIVNDVSGGLFDPGMAAAIAGMGPDVIYVAGHLRGASIAEVFAAERAPTWHEVAAELEARLAALAAARTAAPTTARTTAWADPGLGFGKGADPEGNLALIRHAGAIGRALHAPVVIGASRKRFLRALLAAPTAAEGAEVTRALDAATVAASLAAVTAGAQILRVHNVALLRAALAVYTRL